MTPKQQSFVRSAEDRLVSFHRFFLDLPGRGPALRIVFVWLALVSFARGADYQFSVPVGGSHSDARAFLWIPPKCEHVRGILLGQQVILEKRVCDDPFIRAACTKENLAILLCYDTPLGYFDYSQGADKKLQQILDDLAAESGYSEIARVTLLPFGHSGNAIFAGTIGYWNPARTLGIITLHAATIMPPAFDHKATLDGIPLLAVTGENEMWASTNKPLDMHWRWLRGGLLDLRGQFTDALVSEIVQPGATHFSWDEPLARHVALFIEKVAAARLPKDVASTNLNHLVQADGWLTDNALMTPSRFAPAPYRNFKGDPTLAFWHVDKELALATEHFEAQYKGKADQRVTLVQDGKPIKPEWMPTMKFEPETDGVSFKVAADFLKVTPEGVFGAGQPLGHADGKIKFYLIGGWGGGGEQTGANSFRIRFSNFGINGRGCNLMLMAYQEGDKNFKYAEQPAQVVFPQKLTNGVPQKIKFEQIFDQPREVKTLNLVATSDSGLPVDFLVRQGPCDVRDGKLVFTEIPPRTKFPVKVTVVAWQYGHGGVAPVQSAAPVEQTFLIQTQ